MPKYITGKRGGVYYMKNGRKVYVSKEEKKSIKKRSSKKRSSKGCSNQGKYKGVSKTQFCGPSGGSCEGTFPVTTRKQAVSALAYSRNSPNPQGIRDCVYRIAKEKRWLDKETGKIRTSVKKKSVKKRKSKK